MILNDLPWKRTEIILLFFRLHPSTAFWTFFYSDGYSISSKGFLPAGKRLQYSCLGNPVNSMKRQNDRILKEELPTSVGAQYATGDLRYMVVFKLKTQFHCL